MISVEKPGSPQELVHFGAKGMKWGVRKEEETSGRATKKNNRPTKNRPNKSYSKETKAAVLDHSKKLVNKIQSADDNLTPAQKKKIAYTIIGAVAVTAVVGSAYYLHKQHVINLSQEEHTLRWAAADQKRVTFLHKYYDAIDHATDHSNITPLSYSRPAFEIPSGTTFHRFTSNAEHSFGKVTYASSTEADYNRYVTHFGGLFAHKTEFTSNKALKVPHLNTVLDSLQEIIPGSSREEAIRTYSEMSGTKWDHPQAVKLLSSLKSKGFGAIIDENDAGFLSDRPLLIFDHSGMGSKITHALSQNEILSHIESTVDFASRN